MQRNKNKLVVIFLLMHMHSYSQGIEKKVYYTDRISNENKFIVDGRLNEELWNNESNAKWASGFVQRQPNENSKPSATTNFKIFYDSKYLYVGIKCFDPDPAAISQRMSRRDGYNGDWIEIIIDSYHDLRSAFSFTLSAASVKSDKMLTLNGVEEDLAWNPIWYAKSFITEDGWTAELKIPISQLRFGNSNKLTWGLQVKRKILRFEEISVWQRVPLDAPGWVSEFGLLRGLNNLKPQRQFEIQPFIIGKLSTFERDSSNPFRRNHKKSFNLGLDGKIGVTNDLTLDITINPDFGQVEADPAAIALDGFQLFFKEQRPFFIENKNIFDYRFSTPFIGSIYSSDNLFYSRRIGRSPQVTPELSPGEFINKSQQTTILGAIKFSGKTKKGLSIGVLESITNAEYAEIVGENSQRQTLIEPLTNYFVGRIQKDFDNKRTFLGTILTSVVRNNKAPTNSLHKSAHSFGIDFNHQWDNRTWYFGANLIFSHVNGSSIAIENTQKSIQHLFQRTDASHLSIDTNLKSLSGSGGDIKFGKAGNGHVRFETGFTWRSPQLELNDIGFMREADVIQHYLGFTYRSINSFGPFRNAKLSYQHWVNGDFEGNLNYIDWDLSAEATFKTNWFINGGWFSQPVVYSKSLLQGGPRIRLADQYGIWWGLNSDNRKKLFANYSGWTKTGKTGSYFLLENTISFTYQPVDRIFTTLGAKYTLVDHRLQYIDTKLHHKTNRFITAMLDQVTLSIPIRLNIAINPNLTIQYYAEPFISQGRYKYFNYVSAPLQDFENHQLTFYTPKQISFDNAENTYHINETNDKSATYSFKNPDFSYGQFRSNLVIRYEYIPGSEIYVAWSQSTSESNLPTLNLLRGLENQLFNTPSEHTFLLKMTYRFRK